MIRVVVTSLFAVAAASPISRGADDLAKLRGWIPEEVNAVAVVRVADVMNSPRAKREGWEKSREEAFLAGAMTIPPGVDLLIRGSNVHPRAAAGNWSVAVLAFSRNVDMQRLSLHEQAPVQTVRNFPAIRSPRNCYFALLGPQLLGVVSPAYRQDFARWISRGPTNNESQLSPYLDEALTKSPETIVLAMDLTELFEPDRLRQRLADTTALQGREADQKRIAELCLTLRGIRLAIDVDDSTRSKLTLDFGKPVGNDAGLIKAVLLEALSDLGALVDGIEGSQATADGNEVRLLGELSDEDLRRIMSLVTMPHPSAHVPESADAPTAAPRINSVASAKYFRSIDQILNDLQKANRRAKDYAKTASWHDNFANKIDQLPTAAVDSELVTFGEFVSAKLRALAASLRGMAIDVTTAQSTLTYNYTVDPGYEQVDWWGGYGYRAPSYNYTSNLQQVREKQAAAVSAGENDRNQVWLMIADERARVLRDMTGKFGSDFPNITPSN